ncbi:HD domain-containing phosphohydrolase [Marinobacterium rhizophilum]|uniref:HAMP domain-containing protein n=1 Tax=Marinobacterium rhizophilum TaxID=420402 RepID=A0ABY5HLR4_9GAMM|nr:HD domain-containing phosphohydrolase [Marinobacterium rhizophilum]UTW13332.1 HAMP domain-containing protein [Marinobacterium rhizophilum]
MSSTKPRHYPLHLQITALFMLLILLLGGSLTWYHYRQSSDLILTASAQLFEQYGERLRLEFLRTYQPIVQLINMLALDSIVKAQTATERLTRLTLLARALEQRPQVTALQIGYASGDYLVVRPINGDRLSASLQPPGGSHLIAQSISTDPQGRRQQQDYFFDVDLRLIEQRDTAPSDYDPRQQNWYQLALEHDRHGVTEPYFFPTIGKVGITLSGRDPLQGTVIAADVALDRLSRSISELHITPRSEIVLLDQNFNALAYRDPGKLVLLEQHRIIDIARLDSLGSRVLDAASKPVAAGERRFRLEFDRETWRAELYALEAADGIHFELLILVPENELLSEALRIRRQSNLITGIILMLALPLTWLLARQIARPLRQLALEASQIRRFQLDQPISTRSRIREIDDLGHSMRVMKDTLNQFLGMLGAMSEETAFVPLIELICTQTMSVSQAAGAAIYLVNDDDTRLELASLKLAEATGAAPLLPPCALHGDHQLADCLLHETSLSQTLTHSSIDHPMYPLLQALHTGRLQVISIPLKNRNRESVGVLCLLYGNSQAHCENDLLDFIETLSGFASLTLENRQLIGKEKALLEAFIELIAGAIDAKSPHTGGHCARVPALTEMLARAACDSSDPAFADFSLNDDQWEELHIASWLHDCGKITTPETVVEKATKLETFHDRIHEIRTRFEVLKRDAELRFWRQLHDAKDTERQTLKVRLEATLARELGQLDDDFAFVAQCNLGREQMAQSDQQRLRTLARREWLRTLDDRLGISWEARQRRPGGTVSLPVRETLLADKDFHLIPRTEADYIPANNPWGFRLHQPQHLYNQGELYNLLINAGTLTPEERYKINDHIVQTIIMLEKLPYPRHLRGIPEIAGGHHERMDGRGYPRGLTGEQMSLPARMMAIADIFEALTAADRPYKEPKRLSEALLIMGQMRDRGHIDPHLFRLFLHSGVCEQYACQYLTPAQRDPVDIRRYL